MKRLIIITLLCSTCFNFLQAQKTWVDKGISITQLDTLGDGYEALRGSFIIENRVHMR